MKKSVYFLFILLMSGPILVSTCNDDSLLWDATTKQYTWFTVVSTSPAKSALNVASNAPITIQFSQAINSSTFNGSLIIDSDIGQVDLSQYNITWSADQTTVTLTPTAISGPYPLQQIIYTMTINNANIRSVDANPMENSYSSSFTSLGLADTDPPDVSSSCVKVGANCVPAVGVISPVDGLEIAFDEAMIPTTVESAFSFTVDGTAVSFTTTWSNGNKTALFTFTNLPSGTAIISLTNTASDAAGNSLNTGINGEFIIGGGNIVDYLVGSPNFPPSGVPSTGFTGDFKISNSGTINGASSITWTAYRSSDTSINAGDVQIGTGTTPALNGLTTTSPAAITFSGTWPATVPASYYLIITLSAGDDVNSSNNTRVSSVINVTNGVAFPTFSVPTGTYDNNQSVALSVSSPSASTVIYTSNGTTPTTDANCNATNGTAIASGSSVSITQTTTLKAIGCKVGYINSSETTATYTLKAGTPTFTPNAGSFSSAQNVTVTTTTTGALIKYTTDGSDPTISGTAITTTAPTTVGVVASSNLRARAIKTGYTNSDEGSASYTVTYSADIPTFSVVSGTYTSTQTVAITVASPSGATVIYTTDGSTPTANASCGATNGTAISSGASVSISSPGATVKAIGCKVSYTSSGVNTASYTITGTVSTPIYNVAGANYKVDQTVAISLASPAGATVIYTTDGSTPAADANCIATTGTLIINGTSVSISQTTYAAQTIVLKAIGCRIGYSNSSVALVSYTIQKERIVFSSSRDGNDEIYGMNVDGTGQTNLTNNPAGVDQAPAFSSDGSKIAFNSNRDGNYEIYIMNWDGTGQTRLTNIAANDQVPSFSPDGSKIVFNSYRNGASEIYVMNIDGTAQTNLTNNVAEDQAARFSPDGTKIVFSSIRDGNWEIYTMNADSTGVTRLTNDAGVSLDHNPYYSSDGTKIAFYTNRDGNTEIYIMNVDGSSQTNLTNNGAYEQSASFSPDGTKITFYSNRNGNNEIYIMNVDGSNQTRITNNTASETNPSWGP